LQPYGSLQDVHLSCCSFYSRALGYGVEVNKPYGLAGIELASFWSFL